MEAAAAKAVFCFDCIRGKPVEGTMLVSQSSVSQSLSSGGLWRRGSGIGRHVVSVKSVGAVVAGIDSVDVAVAIEEAVNPRARWMCVLSLAKCQCYPGTMGFA